MSLIGYTTEQLMDMDIDTFFDSIDANPTLPAVQQICDTNDYSNDYDECEDEDEYRCKQARTTPLRSLDQNHSEDEPMPPQQEYLGLYYVPVRVYSDKYDYSPNGKYQWLYMDAEHTRPKQSCLFTSNDRSSFVVQNEETRMNLTFHNTRHFLSWTNTQPQESLVYHELIIGDNRIKPAFDIDGEDILESDTQLYLNVIINVASDELRLIYPYLYNINYIVVDSSKYDPITHRGKLSWHIIFYDYCFPNYRCAKEFAEKVKRALQLLEDIEPMAIVGRYIDMGLYSRNHYLRLPGSHKINDPTRVCKIYISDPCPITYYQAFDYACISSCKKCVLLMDDHKAATNNDTDVPIVLPSNVKQSLVTTIESLYNGAHKFRSMHNNVMSFNRIMPSYCQVCDRNHYNDNTLYAILDVKQCNIYVKCSHNREKGKCEHVIDCAQLLSDAGLINNEPATHTVPTEIIIELDARPTEQLLEVRKQIDTELKSKPTNELLLERRYNVATVIVDRYKFNNSLIDDIGKLMTTGILTDVAIGKCQDAIIVIGELNNILRPIMRCERDVVQKYKRAIDEERTYNKDHNTAEYIKSLRAQYKSDGPVKHTSMFGRTITEIDPNHDNVIHASMGFGKTNMVSRYIDTLPPNMIVIYISFRISFTRSCLGRFKGFHNYQDISEHRIDVDKYMRLFVQVESLSRINIPELMLSGRPYILVCDEVESILTQFAHCGTSESTCFNVFETLFQNASQIILMDANIRANSLMLFNYIKPQFTAQASYLWADTAPYKDRQANMYLHESHWTSSLFMHIDAGNRIVIPINNKLAAKKLFSTITGRYPDKQVRLYTSENAADEDVIAELKDVNVAWIKYDIIIFTPTISAGISFEQVHFDYVYALFNNMSNDTNSACQMIGRVRNWHTLVLYVDQQYINGYISDIDELLNHMNVHWQEIHPQLTTDNVLCKYVNKNPFIDISNHYNLLKLVNMCTKYETRNNMIKELVKLLVGTGIQLDIYGLHKEFINNNLLAEMKTIGRSIKEAELNDIAQAPEMTPSDLQKINCDRTKKDVDMPNHSTVTKAQLRHDYNYAGPMDIDWVRTHIKPKDKRVYRTLRWLYEYNWNIVDAVERLVENDIITDNLTSITYKSPITQLPVNIVTSGPGGYNYADADIKTISQYSDMKATILVLKWTGFGNNFVDNQQILTKLDIEANMSHYQEEMLDNNKLINHVTGRTGTLFGAEFRTIMKTFNKILESTIGCKIVKHTNNGRDSNKVTYALRRSSLMDEVIQNKDINLDIELETVVDRPKPPTVHILDIDTDTASFIDGLVASHT